MDLNLNGRVALVLGASGGLGGAVTRALSAEGVSVALAGRNTEALEAARARVSTVSSTMTVPWDLADLGSAASHVAAIEGHLGVIDIVVNLTGGPPPAPISGQAAETWSAYFRSMVASVIGLTDTVLVGMRERGWGRVITSTSSGVIQPIPNLGLSNALRSTLVGWNKTLASEVAKDGITCNIVVPGRIQTKRTAGLDEARAAREGRDLDDVIADSRTSIPVGRYGQPQEFADLVTFLASPRAAYITGGLIRIDGGLIAAT